MRTRAFLLLFFVSGIAVSQIKVRPNDTLALQDLVVKAENYPEEFPDSTLILSEQVIQIISENRNPPSEIKNKLLEIKGYALLCQGGVYDGYGDIPKAISYFEEALKLFEEINDLRGKAIALGDLAGIYESAGDRTTAFTFYKRSLKLSRQAKDEQGESDQLNNMAHIYQDNKQYDSPLFYFNKSLAIRKAIKDTFGIAISYNNLGTNYFLMGNFSEAERYFRESMPLREQVKDMSGMAASVTNLAYVLLKKEKNKEALEMANEAMRLGRLLNQPGKIRTAAKLYYSIYKKLNNSEKAFENYKLYIKMQDSLNMEMNKKASIKSQLKYEYEKKAAADSVRVMAEKKIIATQLKSEQTKRYTLYGGLVIACLFLLFAVNRFVVTSRQKKIIESQKRIVESQKDIVEEKQKEVLDSIQYAKRIQLSLLANENYINKNIARLKGK